jgi:hypothetical protein
VKVTFVSSFSFLGSPFVLFVPRLPSPLSLTCSLMLSIHCGLSPGVTEQTPCTSTLCGSAVEDVVEEECWAKGEISSRR